MYFLLGTHSIYQAVVVPLCCLCTIFWHSIMLSVLLVCVCKKCVLKKCTFKSQHTSFHFFYAHSDITHSGSVHFCFVQLHFIRISWWFYFLRSRSVSWRRCSIAMIFLNCFLISMTWFSKSWLSFRTKHESKIIKQDLSLEIFWYLRLQTLTLPEFLLLNSTWILKFWAPKEEHNLVWISWYCHFLKSLYRWRIAFSFQC